jgi:hypothetical protein
MMGAGLVQSLAAPSSGWVGGKSMSCSAVANKEYGGYTESLLV